MGAEFTQGMLSCAKNKAKKSLNIRKCRKRRQKVLLHTIFQQPASGLTAAVNCIILVSHPDDDEPLRVISSKQNETDKLLGDMVKTELLLDPDTYIVTLGRTLKAIQAQQAN